VASAEERGISAKAVVPALAVLVVERNVDSCAKLALPSFTPSTFIQSSLKFNRAGSGKEEAEGGREGVKSVQVAACELAQFLLFHDLFHQSLSFVADTRTTKR
jgi:hypothetical protein